MLNVLHILVVFLSSLCVQSYTIFRLLPNLGCLFALVPSLWFHAIGFVDKSVLKYNVHVVEKSGTFSVDVCLVTIMKATKPIEALVVFGHGYVDTVATADSQCKLDSWIPFFLGNPTEEVAIDSAWDLHSPCTLSADLE